MYGITHFFNGFFVVGFASRFFIALVILSYLYSKSKSDRSLKRGLIGLIVAGTIILVLGILATLALFTFSGLGAIFGGHYW